MGKNPTASVGIEPANSGTRGQHANHQTTEAVVPPVLSLYLHDMHRGHAHNRPQGPKGVPGRLRPQIFLTFGTTKVVSRQPHAPAAFTPRGIPWYSFLEAESTSGHMVPSVAMEKIPSVTPLGIDPETVRLVAQCLNHYATPCPDMHRDNHDFTT
jgi:hypothetical protein